MKIELPPGFPIGFQPVDPLVLDLPENNNEAGEIEKPIENQSAPVQSEYLARDRQSELKMSGNLAQTQLHSQVGVLGNGSRGPQVTELQNQLNQWRISQGQTPIAADGIFGKETETAVKEFQKATGLRQDGLAGPEVKKFMGAALELSKDSNFAQLSEQSKRLSIGALIANPTDPGHVANVKDTVKDLREMERDPQFSTLPPQTQLGLRSGMFSYMDRPIGRQFLSDLAKNSRFQDLNPDQQTQMLATIMKNSGNEEGVGDRYPYWVGSLLNTKTMEGPKDDQLTNAVLKTADSVSGDYGKLGVLKEMLNDPQFANAGREDQLAMLNGLAGKSGL